MMANNLEERNSMAFNSVYQQPFSLYFDSVCTSYIYINRTLFSKFHSLTNSTTQLAAYKTEKITEIGTFLITNSDLSGITNLTLKNFLYVSE